MIQYSKSNSWYSGIPDNLERKRCSVSLTVLLDQLDLYIIGKNADFVTFFSNYVLSFAKNMPIYESWEI